MAEVKEIKQSRDGQRMEVLSLVKLASEPISHYWPMGTFIHHNPLHGLEHLPFGEAINKATRFLGGQGYLPNTEYRNYHQQGRITLEAIDEALTDQSTSQHIDIGNRKLSHLEALRAILIHGTGYIAPDVVSALLHGYQNDHEVQALIKRLQALSEPTTPMFSLNDHAITEQKELASAYILSAWCDQTLGTKVQDLMNYELIKWCGSFLDEGHAAWPMPFREKTFYGGWKALAQRDRSGSVLGISQWQSKIYNLPDRPEDAIIESLEAMAIPREWWIDYFTMHFAQLSGWAGFIKWRSEQLDYEWQNANRIDMVKYLAVRLFYEKELVAVACQDKLGISGTYPSIQSYLESHPAGYGLYKEWKLTGLPERVVEDLGLSLFVQHPLPIDGLDQSASRIRETWQSIRQEQDIHQKTLMSLHLAKSLNCSVKELVDCSQETLIRLLEWTSQFPESQHGPIWLKAFELSFIKNFLPGFSPNLEKLGKIDESEEPPAKSRPLAQGIFCIDVRSEGFRRHFEEVGGNETFGFAGFFGVPLSYQGFGSELETDQCPVLLKPKHVIKEIPRAYQAKAAKQYLERQQLAKTGHTLLHDLKENVITPYVMVEAIGWFFGFRLFGQTLSPLWFKRITSWFKERFDIPLGTTLTVDKLTYQEAEEMVASEHRATIYRILIERCGRPGMAVSHDQVERLRKQALSHMTFDPEEDEELLSKIQWTESDHQQFIEDLRSHYGVHDRAVTNRMHRITQTGFTTTEQAHFVETALRAIGSTKTFSRLILACAHGSISDNNPFESALDCGACGGNHGVSNARAFAS
ncbi:MAG: putative inorganic carbon transporter subunit DabA, partial [Nitrospirales bacterium]